MHIYQEDEYLKHASEKISLKIMTPVFIDYNNRKNNVIKNYVYYEQPIKVN